MREKPALSGQTSFHGNNELPRTKAHGKFSSLTGLPTTLPFVCPLASIFTIFFSSLPLRITLATGNQLFGNYLRSLRSVPSSNLITARLLSNWVWKLLQWDLNTKTDIKLDFKRDLVDSSHWDVNRWINLQPDTQSRRILRQMSRRFADHLNKNCSDSLITRSQRRASSIDLFQLPIYANENLFRLSRSALTEGLSAFEIFVPRVAAEKARCGQRQRS